MAACLISKTPCMPLTLSLPFYNQAVVRFPFGLACCKFPREVEEASVAPRAHHCIPASCCFGSSAAFPARKVLLCTSQIFSFFCCFTLVIPVKSSSLSHHLCLNTVLSISLHFSHLWTFLIAFYLLLFASLGLAFAQA